MASQDGSSPFLTRRKEIILAREDVSPPAALYVDGDDELVIHVWNTTAGQLLTLDYRILLADGIISPGRDRIRPNSTGAMHTSIFPLPEGFLLSLTLNCAGPSTVGGECFVRVQIGRGNRTVFAGIYGQLLCSGYISTQHTIGWPFGRMEGPQEGAAFSPVTIGATPAAGAELEVLVPASATWRVITILFTLTTSATAGDRNVRLWLAVGGQPSCMIPSAVALGAGLSRVYQYFVGAVHLESDPGDSEILPLPEGVILTPLSRIFTVTAGLKAGDQYGGPTMIVQETRQG